MLYKNLVIRAGEAPEKVVERLNEELANGWHSSSSISFGGIMIITLEYTDPRIHSLNAKALDLVEVVAAGIEEAIEKIEPTLIEQAKVEVKALFRGAVTEGARNAIGNMRELWVEGRARMGRGGNEEPEEQEVIPPAEAPLPELHAVGASGIATEIRERKKKEKVS